MKHFAVIGDPISLSLSPMLHQEIYQQLGLDASFEKIHVIPDNLHSFMNSNELDGFNVTIPHKQSVIPFLDELDKSAQTIGAVNCIKNGKGFNTDWIGFLQALEINEFNLNGKDCTILGAGGTARSIAFGLIKAFTNNDPSEIPDVIINCTPLGMWPETESMPMALNEIKPNLTLVDTIYNPIETEWLKLGKEKGAKVIGGLDMFIAQGLASADIWFGKKISETVDIEKIRQFLNS